MTHRMTHRPASRDIWRFTWSRTWMLALAILTAGAGVPAAAQEQLPGVFGEIIDVRVINLEVVVTDRDGVRVSGLGPEDFELLVDKQETPIEYFTEVLGGQALATAGAQPGRAAATSPQTAGIPQLSPGKDVGVSYLVFIDEFFSIGRDRDALLESLKEQLPILGPEDRMAIVAYNGKSLEMLTSWTQSKEELEDVLRKAQGRPSEGLRRLAERRAFLDSRDTLGFDGSRQNLRRTRQPGRLDIEEEAFAEQLIEQVDRTVAAATATLRSFASPPGRKVMLLLAGGWPFSPGNFVVADDSRFVIDYDVVGGPRLFQPLVETANRLGYTLYPVDVPGLSSTGTDVEEAEARPLDGGLRVGGDPFLREQELHSALRHLAGETGGRALIDGTRLDSLAKAYEDTRSYYWLGFTPSWQGSDEIHDIRIRVKRPGLKVRTRESFQDLSRSSEVTMMVESALLFGNPPSTLPLAFKVGKARRAGVGKVEVPLEVVIPAEHVTILPQGKDYVAQLELRIAAVDDEGGRSEIPVIPLTLRGAEPPAPEDVMRFETKIKLRKTRQDLLVTVYDPASGNLLAASQQVRF